MNRRSSFTISRWGSLAFRVNSYRARRRSSCVSTYSFHVDTPAALWTSRQSSRWYASPSNRYRRRATETRASHQLEMFKRKPAEPPAGDVQEEAVRAVHRDEVAGPLGGLERVELGDFVRRDRDLHVGLQRLRQLRV